MSENLKTSDQRVAWLLDKVPEVRSNYSLLLLLYWSVFDGIDIPKKMMQGILSDGTKPETISRGRRRVTELKRQLVDIDVEIDKLILESKEICKG